MDHLDIRELLLTLFIVEFGSCSIVPESSSSVTEASAANLFVVGTVCCTFLITLVLALLSCGGCNDMGGDVATENHPACGKRGSNYDAVVDTANTGVLMSSHTMGESYMIPPQNLPYSLQPASAQGFTGYESGTAPPVSAAQAPLMGGHRPAFEPPPPSYEQLNRQGSLSGY